MKLPNYDKLKKNAQKKQLPIKELICGGKLISMNYAIIK